MNLNEIIEKIYDAASSLDAESLVELQNVAHQLTPRSMDQKPDHDQWCLVFNKSGACFVGKYIKPLDSFIDEIGTRKSSSFKWLPAPTWKEEK